MNDVVTLLFLEFEEGSTLVIEHSNTMRLCNFKSLKNTSLLGYRIEDNPSNNLHTLTLLTPKDIIEYIINPAYYEDFSKLQPKSFKQVPELPP